jgi:ParB family chromosome partitioning protein
MEIQMQTTYEIGQVYKFLLADLIRSTALNVRTKQERTAAKYQTGIEELGALILAQGLLQNLTGFQQKKGKKILRTIEVVAGGRRLDALTWLATTGQIDPATFEIEVKICTEAEARAKSLTENSGREALAPADQFRAFAAMVADGKTTEEIATAFGVDEVTIKRRLKLANVAPALFALYENDEATLDQLMALALTDDHTTQIQVWESLGQYNRSHSQIRNLITSQEINVANSKVAAFVGMEAYIAAGGPVRQDLFSNGGGYIQDAALLESLAVAKLELSAPDLAATGLKWVECTTNISYDELNRFSHAKKIRAPITEEEQTKLTTLECRKIDLDEKIGEIYDAEEELTGEQQAQLEALEKESEDVQEEIDAIEDRQFIVDPDEAALAGAIVTLDHAGAVKVHLGLIRPEDKKEMQKIAAATRVLAGEPPEEGDIPKEKSVHSERLTRQLTAHRTAALQVEVAARTDVALVVLAHKLMLTVFKFGRSHHRIESAAQITLTHTYLESESDDVKSCLALAKFNDKQAEWEDMLPEPEKLFDWLLSQDQSVILKLLAHCTAYSLNTVQGNENTNVPAAQIGKAVGLDMANWWQPTRETYFAQVSKHHIINVVSAAISPEIAKPMADMKKIPLTEAAEENMRDSRWLPPILQAA